MTNIMKSFCYYATLVVLLALATGCATGSKTATGPKYIFYPPAPEPPRLQFLVSYSDEADLGARVNRFAQFVTGAEPSRLPIVKPYGLAMAGNRLFVCDTASRGVDVLDLENKTMRLFMPTGMAQLHTPINIAVDADGSRYVADTGRNLVLTYGADETYRGAIGDKEKLKPTGVAVSGDRLYVSDLEGHCVRVYNKADRKPLFTIPREPQADQPGKLFMPVNIALDAKGQVYVSDMAACQVFLFDGEGKFVRTFGSRGDMPGQLARPKGVAVDREGRVYVVDAAAQVCQIFDAEGKLLLYFGEPDGSPAPMNLPAAVIVDDKHIALFQKYTAPDFIVEHLVIISNQYGDKRVSVYGLGHKK